MPQLANNKACKDCQYFNPINKFCIIFGITVQRDHIGCAVEAPLKIKKEEIK